MKQYRVVNSKRHRETPCCRQPVRVKIKEPGVQSRPCPLCHAVNYFVLEGSADPKWEGSLFMRWISADEAKRIEAGMAAGDELADPNLLDLSTFT